MYRPHFILVEDTPSDVDLALIVVKSTGIDLETRVCRDGQEALDRLLPKMPTSDSALPRFVVTDLKMPRVGGLRLLEAMRSNEQTRRIPVVVFSSSADSSDIERAYSLGVNAYCIKPMGYKNFSLALGTLVRFWSEVVAPA
jgi:CheY-like chemotaxis protein